jgi:hypothetical protein
MWRAQDRASPSPTITTTYHALTIVVARSLASGPSLGRTNRIAGARRFSASGAPVALSSGEDIRLDRVCIQAQLDIFNMLDDSTDSPNTTRFAFGMAAAAFNHGLVAQSPEAPRRRLV